MYHCFNFISWKIL